MKQKNLIGVVSSTLFLIISISVNGNSAIKNPETDPVDRDTIVSNTYYSIGGVQFYNNNILVLSNTKYQHKMIGGHISFGVNDIFFKSEENDELSGKFMQGKPFSVAPAEISIDKRNSVVYFSKNDKKGEPKIYSLPITSNTHDESAVKLLSFCEGGFSYQHPAISNNSDFIIFSSNREGTLGGFDLYISRSNNIGWHEVQNLGEYINTTDDECYPFLDSYNNLYFSSRGHSGLGGYDVFFCAYTGDGWAKPLNLMRSVNSEKDEIGFKVNDSNTTSYYIIKDIEPQSQAELIRLNTSSDLTGSLIMQARNDYSELTGITYSAEQESANITSISTAAIKDQDETDKEKINELKAEEPDAGSHVSENAKPDKQENKSVDSGKPEEVKEDIHTNIPEETAKKVTKPEETSTKALPVEEPVETANAAIRPENARSDQMITKEDESEAEEVNNNAVIFRVQISSSRTSKPGHKVTINGTTYTCFEYYYKGAYRQCVGGSEELDDAKELQSRCRASGFPQAFVAAFINDERTTDPAVFRK